MDIIKPNTKTINIEQLEDFMMALKYSQELVVRLDNLKKQEELVLAQLKDIKVVAEFVNFYKDRGITPMYNRQDIEKICSKIHTRITQMEKK
jgi:Zn-dependent oligopeptidase